MFAEVHQDVDEGMADCAWRRELPRVIPIAPELTTSPERAVHGARETDSQAP
jgi:hypothetical protein